MEAFRQLLILSAWEIRRFAGNMSKDLFLAAFVLIILLVGVTGFSAQNGIHLNDGIYRIGIDNKVYLDIIGNDPRFLVYSLPSEISDIRALGLDLTIKDGSLMRTNGDKGSAAQISFERDYQTYLDNIYRQQTDLFASYPVWVDSEYVVSELDFLATQNGRSIAAPYLVSQTPPEPEQPVLGITYPTNLVPSDSESLRLQLEKDASRGDDQLGRYTNLLKQQEATGEVRIPSMLSPPLPFDTIIFIFIFIFPLYFTSQFFMMSIMNERTLRQGEALIASPVRPSVIVIGKMLPYVCGMLLIILVVLLVVRADLIAILPLIPIIFFFLAFALLIGMVSRSYKELSFISIFFSTIATSYLFFPSIFANVHIVSLLSPITLVVHVIDGTGFTSSDYLYSTSLFYLSSVIIFFICIRNFHEEQLFTEKGLMDTLSLYLGELISTKFWYLSLIFIAVISIPFVFMAQMMYLVLFFNLPMPYSLLIIIFLAAFTEELVKSAGLIGLIKHNRPVFSWPVVVASALFIAIGFLIGEKLLLFITLSQISDSIFGAALYMSIGLIWMPLLLHFTTVLCTGFSVKIGGKRMFPVGILLATLLHTIYNLYLLRGWVW